MEKLLYWLGWFFSYFSFGFFLRLFFHSVVFLLYDAERVKREANVFLVAAYPRRIEFRSCLFLFYIYSFSSLCCGFPPSRKDSTCLSDLDNKRFGSLFLDLYRAPCIYRHQSAILRYAPLDLSLSSIRTSSSRILVGFIHSLCFSMVVWRTFAPLSLDTAIQQLHYMIW